ncbi:DUF6083 domain-containing protein [Streptomyces sp. BK340]|uniref:DUF6083 domain-containing protein n=1 Tax=Streptomyces sp. BK340 TaxID=2572903 RepID=UPI001C95836A|nr:DUF6083 domain-containing protein [Streptomyces sp. BK340]
MRASSRRRSKPPDQVEPVHHLHGRNLCPECGASIRVYPTNYGRWVSLAMVELPAKDVPEAFRWRLTRLPARSIPADIVAVRVRGIDPLPSEPVVPAHSMMCVPDWGEP